MMTFEEVLASAAIHPSLRSVPPSSLLAPGIRLVGEAHAVSAAVANLVAWAWDDGFEAARTLLPAVSDGTLAARQLLVDTFDASL